MADSSVVENPSTSDEKDVDSSKKEGKTQRLHVQWMKGKGKT